MKNKTRFSWHTVRKNPTKSDKVMHTLATICTAMISFILVCPLSPMFASALLMLGISVAFRFVKLPFGILALTGFACNYGFADTGIGCTVIQKVATRIFMVPYYNAAGQKNGIALNGTVSAVTNGTFTQPGFGFSANVTFVSTSGFYQNMVFLLTDSNGVTCFYYVKSITSSTVAVCVNMSIVGGAAQGTTIATTATVLNAFTFTNNFFTNMINHPDPSQRWFPLPLMKNGSNKRANSILKQYDDQTETVVQQGARKLTAIIPGKLASTGLLGAILSGRQLDAGIYVLDKDGNLIGTVDNPASITYLYSTKMDTNSLDPIYNPGDDKNEQEVMLSFNIDSTENDTYLNALAGSMNGLSGDIDPGANLANIQAVINVSAVFSLIDTSTSSKTFTMRLKTMAGSALSAVNDTGLIVSNLISPVTGLSAKVYDATAAADVAVTSVTEILGATGRPTGVYTVILGATVTAADKLSVGVVRPNRDYSSIPAQAGTSPNYSFASV